MALSLTIASKAYSVIHIMVIIRFKSARSSYALGGGMADHCSNIGPSHAMVVTSIPWNCSLPSTFVAVASPPIGSAIGVVMVELLSKSQQPCTCNFSLHVVSNFVESHNTPLPQSHRNITIPRISYLSCLHHAIACRKRG